MSSYNSQHEEPPEEEHSNRCPAAGCPLPASIFLDGGPWTCRYHSKQPVHIWLKVTELLKNNKRWFLILKAADELGASEYDELQRKDAFELDELLRPVKGEVYPAWLMRLKETIYRALKEKINQIAETNDVGASSFSNKAAVRQLSSGIFLKKGKG